MAALRAGVGRSAPNTGDAAGTSDAGMAGAMSSAASGSFREARVSLAVDS